jgi:hypothetical protein
VNDIQISWQGVGEVIARTHDQYLNLSEASGFTCAGGLADVGAFTGVLGLFRGSYQSAYTTVSESLDTAMQGARDLVEAMTAARDDLWERDVEVGVLHTTLTSQVEAGEPYRLRADGGVPQVDDQLVNANDLLTGVPWHGPGPRMPGGLGVPSAGAPVALADSLMSMADNAAGTGSSLDHHEDIDDYLDDNR